MPSSRPRPRYQGVIAHGMWGAALISAVLGTRLPGAGTVYERQTLQLSRADPRRRHADDDRQGHRARRAREPRVTLDCTCVNQRGTDRDRRRGVVTAPTERIERSRSTLAAGAHLGLAGRRPRAPAAARASARSHQDGRRSSHRRRQPLGCARCARGGAHRAGARRAARASRSGRDRRPSCRSTAWRSRTVPDARAAAARAVELAVKGRSAR